MEQDNQRLIKFRAWNNYPELEEPYMMSWKDLDKADNDGIFLLFDILSGKEKSITPMQYTGLKDKNGINELYEGDVISLNGIKIGNKYENEIILQEKTNLIIKGMGTNKWKDTEQKACERGCYYAK